MKKTLAIFACILLASVFLASFFSTKSTDKSTNQSTDQTVGESGNGAIVNGGVQGKVLAATTDGLVGYYTFDDNVADSAGTNHGTTVGSPVYTTGKIGKALVLDGVNDCVTMGDVPAYDFGSATSFTVSWWYKSASGHNPIITKKTQSGATASGFYYTVLSSSGGTIDLRIADGVNQASVYNNTFSVNNNQWRHVAVVVDRSTNSMRAYVDNVATPSVNIASVGSLDNATNFTIGGRSSSLGTCSSFIGATIDDLRIYNRALNVGEIAEIYSPTVSTGQSNVSGHAWSPNIGWISFNCLNTNTCETSPYGVDINTNSGNISGHAWSSNIGWISFSETGGCPSAPCNAYIEGVSPSTMTGYKAVKGWAKAVVGGSAEAGSWDGWIKLDHNQTNPLTYSFENKEFKGYAWGGPLVLGWISFNSSNTGTNPPYSVTGPGPNTTNFTPLGSISTAPSCDLNKDSYMEVSVPTNGNTANNILYTAYRVVGGVAVSALSPGSPRNSGSEMVFRDYSASTSTSYAYVITASIFSPPAATSTATSSSVSLGADWNCKTDPNDGSKLSGTFTLNPFIVTPPQECTGTWSATHDGNPDEVEMACTLTAGTQPSAPVNPSGTGNVDYGSITFRCTLRNIEDPDIEYDTLSITRKCFRNADVIEN